MEVRAYTPQLDLIGFIEDFSSLVWRRKYSTAGDFELHAPATAYNVNLLARGNIISYDGAAEAGVVESILLEQDAKKNEITAKGRFLSSYMDRRTVHGAEKPAYNYSGTVEGGMRAILANAVPLPLVELGELQGYTERATFQSTYQNLLTLESKLADSIGIGFRFTPDFEAKKITFDIYRGLDHSVNQSDRARVTFSEDYNNINGATFSENDQLLKTVCYIGGQGEGENRVWVTVGDDTATGLERREAKRNATDIDPADLTEEQYLDKLRQRGETALEECSLAQSFECDTAADGNFVYKRDYDLGDIVTVQKSGWGISLDMRLTEIMETYEHGRATIVPTFGNPLPDTIDWEND